MSANHTRSATRATRLLFAWALALSGCAAFDPPLPEPAPIYHARAGGPLRAGAAAVEITPEGPVWMGGYGLLRRSRDVHDPLFARALVLEAGALRVALVALDVVGLQQGDRRALDAGLVAEGFDPRHVLVHATHNHAGPDTLGIWGLPPFFSGQGRAAMARLEAGVFEALRRARAELRPAELAARGVRLEPQGLLRNLRRPGLVDAELVVLHVREAGGGPAIATLLELGCHPEALSRSNQQLSADFPGVAVAGLEQALGGVGIYVSGALGGLVSPDLLSEDERDGFAEVTRIGTRLAEAGSAAVAGLEAYERAPALALWHTPLALRNANWRYRLLQRTGVLDRELHRGGWVQSEVNLWAIGALRIASVPGEITPDLGLRIKRAAGGRPSLVLGLANDELGYLLPAADYDLPLYDYERTVSPGRDAGDRVLRHLEDLALLAAAADGSAQARKAPSEPQASEVQETASPKGAQRGAAERSSVER